MLVPINKIMFYEVKINESKFTLASSSFWLKALIRMAAVQFFTDLMVIQHNFRSSALITTFYSQRRLAVLLMLALYYSTNYIMQL